MPHERQRTPSCVRSSRPPGSAVRILDKRLPPVHSSSVEVTELVRPDVDELHDFWSVGAAARPLDAPLLPYQPFEELVRAHDDTRTSREHRWIARVEGRPVGTAQLMLPLLENIDVANVTVVVHPVARRRGTGRALATTVIDRMRREGRSQLFCEIPEPLDRAPTPGTAFAAQMGATRALEEICRILDLGEVDDNRLSALEHDAAAHAVGYELVQWAGPAPDDNIDDLAVLTGRMSTDAPMGDLDWEPEEWDRARVREAEERSTQMGRQWVTTAARHVDSGHVVAYTDIGVSPGQPGPAFQWVTIVEPGHRGKRLGLLVKAANLRLLRRELTGYDRVITWNAESNTQMIAINDALGFRPRFRYCEWKLVLGSPG